MTVPTNVKTVAHSDTISPVSILSFPAVRRRVWDLASTSPLESKLDICPLSRLIADEGITAFGRGVQKFSAHLSIVR